MLFVRLPFGERAIGPGSEMRVGVRQVDVARVLRRNLGYRAATYHRGEKQGPHGSTLIHREPPHSLLAPEVLHTS